MSTREERAIARAKELGLGYENIQQNFRDMLNTMVPDQETLQREGVANCAALVYVNACFFRDAALLILEKMPPPRHIAAAAESAVAAQKELIVVELENMMRESRLGPVDPLGIVGRS